MSGSRTVILGEPRPWEPKYRLARTIRATLAKLALLAFRTRIVGAHHVPDDGAILAGNHVSYADPVLLWCGAPRPVHFMAKSELWNTGYLGWGLPRLWAFPVRRGAADREAIAAATAYLQGGDLVGIFPEGTRHREGDGSLGAAQEGVAFIALRAGVPIVPVSISGTDRILPDGARMLRFPRVTITCAEPVCPDDFADLPKRERLAAMTSLVMERISQGLDDIGEG